MHLTCIFKISEFFKKAKPVNFTKKTSTCEFYSEKTSTWSLLIFRGHTPGGVHVATSFGHLTWILVKFF